MHAKVEEMTADDGSKEKGLLVKMFVYQTERKALNAILDKLYERNKNVFSDRENIFDLFAGGMLSGKILPLARLIEKTFGTGTLRKLGEVGDDAGKLQALVESL